MNKAFYNKVISLIPSADLRQCVKERNYQFGEKEVLKLILDYAPYFEKRIEMLETAAEVLEDKAMRTLAKKRITLEHKIYDAFMSAGDGYVFETDVKISPNDVGDDTLITKTYEDALRVIDSCLKCYEITAKERAGARYTIKKKTVGVPQKPNDIYKGRVGTVGQCVLDCKLKILSLDAYAFKQEVPCKKGVYCYECGRCIDSTELHYPAFLNCFDLVAYYDNYLYDPSHLTYGILCCDMQDGDFDSYVVSIDDNEYIKNRTVDYQDENGYYRVFDYHDHPDYSRIIKVEEKDAPKDTYANYLYAADCLRKMDACFKTSSD